MLSSNLSVNSKPSNANAMDNFQSIEDKLSQLIPSSVSEEGQMKMEDTIDELAGSSFDVAEIATSVDSSQDSLLQAGTEVTGGASWPWKARAREKAAHPGSWDC